MTGEQVKVGGVWLTTIAPWGGLKWSTLADGGCGPASWSMALPRYFSHPALRRGKLVEIKAGSRNLWRGVLAAPAEGEDGWDFTADGLSALGNDYLAFDSGLNATTTPNTAVDQAISRGLPWTRPTSLSGSALATPEDSNALEYVGPLLTRWATSVSKRWGVDADGAVYATADPTTPTWHMTPGSGRFGLADDDYASDVYLRYKSSAAVWATAHAGSTSAAAQYGRKEYAEDATGGGLLTSGAAGSLAAGVIAKGKPLLGWTNSLTPTRWQLTTPGGTPAWLPLVKAGQMVRLHGVIDEQGRARARVDFVIGQAEYDAAEDTLTLSPVGLAPRTYRDVVAAMTAGK